MQNAPNTTSGSPHFKENDCGLSPPLTKWTIQPLENYGIVPNGFYLNFKTTNTTPITNFFIYSMADMETPTKFRKVTNCHGYNSDSKQLFADRAIISSFALWKPSSMTCWTVMALWSVDQEGMLRWRLEDLAKKSEFIGYQTPRVLNEPNKVNLCTSTRVSVEEFTSFFQKLNKLGAFSPTKMFLLEVLTTSQMALDAMNAVLLNRGTMIHVDLTGQEEVQPMATLSTVDVAMAIGSRVIGEDSQEDTQDNAFFTN
jgi:hypothetical protein